MNADQILTQLQRNEGHFAKTPSSMQLPIAMT
jgi:hypothetical protein